MTRAFSGGLASNHSKHKRVVGCVPVPKAKPGSSRIQVALSFKAVISSDAVSTESIICLLRSFFEDREAVSAVFEEFFLAISALPTTLEIPVFETSGACQLGQIQSFSPKQSGFQSFIDSLIQSFSAIDST